MKKKTFQKNLCFFPASALFEISLKEKDAGKKEEEAYLKCSLLVMNKISYFSWLALTFIIVEFLIWQNLSKKIPLIVLCGIRVIIIIINIVVVVGIVAAATHSRSAGKQLLLLIYSFGLTIIAIFYFIYSYLILGLMQTPPESSNSSRHQPQRRNQNQPQWQHPQNQIFPPNNTLFANNNVGGRHGIFMPLPPPSYPQQQQQQGPFQPQYYNQRRGGKWLNLDFF